MAETAYGPTSALVVVDVQNDFADPAGSLYVAGGDEIVPVINDHIAAATAAGALVVYTQDWHPEVTPHFADHGGVWPVHCVRDTWGAELHPDLTVGGPVIRKGTNGEDGYSGFTMRDPETGEETTTGLEAEIVAHGATEVVVVGLAFDVCVKATALDSLANGHRTSVPLEASRSVQLQPGDSERAAIELTRAGAVVA
ncbi:MAG: isochorismatase family protein [Acidimicrobiales bacterium]